MCQYDTFCFMSKKRKTRRDKELADTRRTHSELSHTVTPERTISFSLNNIPEKKETPRIVIPSTTTIRNHDYVILDVRKTLVITILLLILNSAMYFAIQHGLIHLTFLGM